VVLSECWLLEPQPVVLWPAPMLLFISKQLSRLRYHGYLLLVVVPLAVRLVLTPSLGVFQLEL